MELMSQAEVAKLLGVHRSTVSRMLKRGTLPYYEIGRLKKVDRADLEALRIEKKSIPIVTD